MELNARDWCASALHEERIVQALRDLTDPIPAEVRKILNDLGHVDERIHDLKQSGAATRFFLDLREGGRLCPEGSAAGEETVVDTCVAPAAGRSCREAERVATSRADLVRVPPGGAIPRRAAGRSSPGPRARA
ncbi:MULTISPECIES: hypothetical protein [unclassified Streptomyces]|uniref:hypothetical protein n=1 Tax=unclassified Streptomyces TaxID=2593676 RepID=UPI002E0F7494|nr:hypothetical protein OG457_37325 [Streptomyces sp. NBC_01207]WTA22294.1 hypothetical protein OG365_32070 [Streptomyces sp. NBC_00853]